MVTSIQVSDKLKEYLSRRKSSPKDSYEDIIWDLLEDTLELSEQTKTEITHARAEFKRGETIPHAKVKRELGL